MNPIVRFIRQREPNSTTVLLMKLQSTLEGRSHRAWVPVMPREPQGSMRIDSSNVHTVRWLFCSMNLEGGFKGQGGPRSWLGSRVTGATEGSELGAKVGRR